MHLGADRAGLDLGSDVRDLMVAEGLVYEDLVGRRLGIRVAGEVLGVAVRFAAVAVIASVPVNRR